MCGHVVWSFRVVEYSRFKAPIHQNLFKLLVKCTTEYLPTSHSLMDTHTHTHAHTDTNTDTHTHRHMHKHTNTDIDANTS